MPNGHWFTSHRIGDREVARPTAFHRDCVNRRVSRVFHKLSIGDRIFPWC